MWFKYVKERLGYDSVKTSEGFCTYTIHDRVFLLTDIYLTSYDMHKAIELYDLVKKAWESSGCEYVEFGVPIDDAGLNCKVKMLHRFGMSIVGLFDNKLIMQKEV